MYKLTVSALLALAQKTREELLEVKSAIPVMLEIGNTPAVQALQAGEDMHLRYMFWIFKQLESHDDGWTDEESEEHAKIWLSGTAEVIL